MTIPAPVAQILNALRAAGHQAFLVGGCVRDILLHSEPKDYDIATSARPVEVIGIFPKADPVGAKFGVLLLNGVEIATFRSDGAYTDGRRPEGVHFESNPANDAARRDFTINGLFYDDTAGQILDYVGGQSDLANRVIRAIGNPAERFAEDHLRMLRAVRFATRLDFEIEPGTADAIRAQAGQIRHISPERTRDELTRILTGPHPRRGFEWLDELGLLEHILPEVKAMQGVPQPPDFHPEGDVWTHTLMLLDGLQNPSIELAWAALLHDVGKPVTFTNTDRIRFNGHAEKGARMAQEILTRLRYPSAVIDRVEEMVAQHMKFLEVRRMKESTRKRFLRQPGFANLLELHRLDAQASNGNMAYHDFCKEELDRLPPEALRPPRLLTGADLLDLGIPEGPEIGRILQKIEDAQLEGAITTETQARTLAETTATPRRES